MSSLSAHYTRFFLLLALCLFAPQLLADCPKGYKVDGLNTKSCYKCPSSYKRNGWQTNPAAKDGCFRNIGWRYKAPNWKWATKKSGLFGIISYSCRSGSLFDKRCFSCSGGYKKNITRSWYKSNACEAPPYKAYSKASVKPNTCGSSGDRACTVTERIPSCDANLVEKTGRCIRPACGRLNEKACLLTQRIPSCDSGLIEFAGKCFKKNACGKINGRPCAVTERVPSCDANLIEKSGKCIRLDCGKDGERACLITERIPSCDTNLIEKSGKCYRPDCGRVGQRSCLITERIPSCDAGGIEIWGKCKKTGVCGSENNRACTIVERIPSCDKGLVEVSGRCYKKGICGAKGQRPCQLVERFPSCNKGLAEDFMKNQCVKDTLVCNLAFDTRDALQRVTSLVDLPKPNFPMPPIPIDELKRELEKLLLKDAIEKQLSAISNKIDLESKEVREFYKLVKKIQAKAPQISKILANRSICQTSGKELSNKIRKLGINLDSLTPDGNASLFDFFMRSAQAHGNDPHDLRSKNLQISIQQELFSAGPVITFEQVGDLYYSLAVRFIFDFEGHVGLFLHHITKYKRPVDLFEQKEYVKVGGPITIGFHFPETGYNRFPEPVLTSRLGLMVKKVGLSGGWGDAIFGIASGGKHQLSNIAITVQEPTKTLKIEPLERYMSPPSGGKALKPIISPIGILHPLSVNNPKSVLANQKKKPDTRTSNIPKESTSDWKTVPRLKATKIASGGRNQIYAIDLKKQLRVQKVDSPKSTEFSGKLKDVAVFNKNKVYAISDKNSRLLTLKNKKWKRLLPNDKNKYRDISLKQDGTLIAVRVNGQVVTIDTKALKIAPLSQKKRELHSTIVNHKNDLWGIDKQKRIVRFVKGKWKNLKTDFKANSIAFDEKGTLHAIASTGNLRKYKGKNKKWVLVKMEAKLKSISSGRNNKLRLITRKNAVLYQP